MNQYLVKQEATIGSEPDYMSSLPPIVLTFYTTVEAESVDDATSKSTVYIDPHFKTKIVDVTPLKGKTMSMTKLCKMLEQSSVLHSRPL